MWGLTKRTTFAHWLSINIWPSSSQRLTHNAAANDAQRNQAVISWNIENNPIRKTQTLLDKQHGKDMDQSNRPHPERLFQTSGNEGHSDPTAWCYNHNVIYMKSNFTLLF